MALSAPATAEDSAAGTLRLAAQGEHNEDNEAGNEEANPDACDYWNIHDCSLFQGLQLFVDGVLQHICCRLVHPHIFREHFLLFPSLTFPLVSQITFSGYSLSEALFSETMK